MKLSKVYANNIKFKPIFFHGGLNVVYGDVENVGFGKVQEHNLGKTSLVSLIDFMLLKKVEKKSIFGKHLGSFEGWIFFLEIELNSGEFLTIRRAVIPNSKISFKKHNLKYQDFTLESRWDYEDLPLNGTLEESNPKLILQKQLLKFDVSTRYNYRWFVSYLLRTQNDYRDPFLLSKFKGKDKDWKPNLFDLLGFNSALLEKKYQFDEDIAAEKKDIKRLVNSEEVNETFKLRAAIEAKKNELKNLKEKTKDFDFYSKEQNINFSLVRDIELKVSDFNKRKYRLDLKIQQINASLDSSKQSSVNMDEILGLYEEIKVHFPNELTKDYKDVVNFNEQITKERDAYLKEELKTLKERREVVDNDLKALNKERIKLLSFLKEKDTFIKFQNFQDELLKIESEIISFEQKLENTLGVERMKKTIESISSNIKSLTEDIKNEIENENVEFSKIKRLFQEIYAATFDYTALLVIEPNKAGNIDFEASVLTNTQELSGKADGYTSTKVLCASFVLAILLFYSNKSYFRFAYHDGIFESWGDDHKVRFIKYLRENLEMYGIQYVVSLIKSDLPKDFEFTNEEIIRSLSKNDTLFGFDF